VPSPNCRVYANRGVLVPPHVLSERARQAPGGEYDVPAAAVAGGEVPRSNRARGTAAPAAAPVEGEPQRVIRSFLRVVDRPLGAGRYTISAVYSLSGRMTWTRLQGAIPELRLGSFNSAPEDDHSPGGSVHRTLPSKYLPWHFLDFIPLPPGTTFVPSIRQSIWPADLRDGILEQDGRLVECLRSRQVLWCATPV
jgi:hypothetical protein